ncbi:hypothetical protein F5Y19DRAFT_465782 [Xylariaceae sp. FL1651]|nr:hypothetical protein F5Y19DRAFT_465782 [Xylariaceae sp. FL1651]
MAFATTNIGGKQCTVVPKSNNVVGGQTTTSSSTLATSTSTSTFSTSFSTSSTTISIPSSISNTLPIAAEPAITTIDTSTPETLTTPTVPSDVSPGTPTPSGGLAESITIGTGAVESSSSAGAGSTTNAQNVTGNAISTQTTVAVAGGVIGGLAVVSLVAFLVWFWRKRLMKKRRSTLLTPLSADGADARGEKGPYIISRNSLGPTTIPEKLRAVVGYNYQRLRGRVNSLVARSPKPSVDLNRGNSQFGLPDTTASRSSSRAGNAGTGTTTAKGRFVDWWGRLTEDGNLNWKLRSDPKSGRLNNDTFTALPSTAGNKRRGSQPDFLTLLSMDEKQQGAGNAAGGGGSSSSGNPRRSQSLGSDHFLGGLGLNFDTENPFADSNAMSHDSAKVMPLTVSGANNPFSDANAIPGPPRSASNNGAGAGPATYVQNIRRSRGYSASTANLQPPSAVTAARLPSMYRESSVSVESFDTRRNKFRSDPFDLDRPELLVQSPQSSTRGVAGSSDGGRSSRYSRHNSAKGLPNMPRPAHARAESFTSKYSSGVSMGEWSDPGPDVGPAAGRWDTPSPDGALGRKPGGGAADGERRKSGGSQGSVGKAL